MGYNHSLKVVGFSLLLALLSTPILIATSPDNVVTTFNNYHSEPKYIVSIDVPWLDGWNYRKAHHLEGTPGCGENYQIRIIVDYGTDSDFANTIYTDSKCHINFTDIRFTDNDGVSLLDYWIEDITTGVEATFWIEVQDNLDFNTTIYVYYGNVEAISNSNGDDTFLLFDHFYGDTLNSTKWFEYYSNGSLAVSNSNLVVTGASGLWEEVGSKSQWDDNISVHVYTRCDEQNYFQVGIDDRTKDGIFQGSGYSQSGFRYSTNSHYRSSHDGASASATRSYLINSYTHISLSWHSGAYTKYYVNDILQATISTIVPSDIMGVAFSAREVTTDVWVDWVFVSKHNPSGEPTHDIWNVEEYSAQVDSFKPQIDSPANLQYEGGTTGHSITWVPEDVYPAAYEFRIDGSIVDSGDWTGSSITMSVDGISFGSHECNLTVLDIKGNAASDDVQVQVIDTTNPTLSSPDDIIYVLDTTGNVIQWTAADFSPSSFVITQNGTIVASGPWTNNPQNLTIPIDGLLLGTYEFVITVQDRAENTATNIVYVQVIAANNILLIGAGVGVIAIIVIIGGVVCTRKR
ncbi:MAG: DUF2341 domain-containing protein [Candidatus Thorarchaeota archaeon]